MAVPPQLTAEAASRAAIEQRTGIDLASVWERYVREHRPGQPFLDFTRRQFRRRYGVGVGLTLGGSALTVLGIVLVLAAASRPDVSEDVVIADVLGGTFVLAAGFSLVVPGGVIWGVSGARLRKLRNAGFTARERGPTLSLAPAGLRLAF